MVIWAFDFLTSLSALHHGIRYMLEATGSFRGRSNIHSNYKAIPKQQKIEDHRPFIPSSPTHSGNPPLLYSRETDSVPSSLCDRESGTSSRNGRDDTGFLQSRS